eukprot:Pompholyxophrys_sp_v1_NODE_327_length_749_cov_2.782421.p2 type:complete len:123 gc:universal NODE_327_length_749_cov_2.782421:86-454(+)
MRFKQFKDIRKEMHTHLIATFKQYSNARIHKCKVESPSSSASSLMGIFLTLSKSFIMDGVAPQILQVMQPVLQMFEATFPSIIVRKSLCSIMRPSLSWVGCNFEISASIICFSKTFAVTSSF